MTDKQPEALIRADELETIGAESSLARAMAAHTIRLLYKENEALRARLAQPECEWIGLTDEEVKAAWSQLWYDLGNGKFAASDDPARHTTIMFAKEIEAKLKEKNT